MKNYNVRYKELNQLFKDMGQDIPETMTAFNTLSKASTAEGALSTKVKELIALGMGVALRCDGCIAFHVYAALQAGATKDEIMETIGVAILMGGGPAVVYGAEAKYALEQYLNDM